MQKSLYKTLPSVYILSVTNFPEINQETHLTNSAVHSTEQLPTFHVVREVHNVLAARCSSVHCAHCAGSKVFISVLCTLCWQQCVKQCTVHWQQCVHQCTVHTVLAAMCSTVHCAHYQSIRSDKTLDYKYMFLLMKF